MRVIHIVKMIYNVSHHYNTPERVASLLVKITNQVIRTCKRYITQGGRKTIWNQDRLDVEEKLMQCIKLNQDYKDAYARVKNRKVGKEIREFSFSEKYIFGRFDSFCTRLRNLLSMFKKINLYTRLFNERMEALLPEEALADDYKVFDSAVRVLTLRDYDYLDFRNEGFDKDYVEFLNRMDTMTEKLQNKLETTYDGVWDTPHAFQYLPRFEKLSEVMPVGHLTEKYVRMITTFSQEMERITKFFKKQLQKPPIPRNYPDSSGRIAWARSLLQHLKYFMEHFMSQKTLKMRPEYSSLVKQYNETGVMLMKYELDIQENWKNLRIRQIELMISKPIFATSDSGEFVSNFDRVFYNFLKENERLAKMDINIPSINQFLIKRKDYFIEYYDTVNMILERYNTAMSIITPDLRRLFTPHVNKMRTSLEPGLSEITWTNFDWVEFTDKCLEDIDNFRYLMSRANDIYTNRIEKVLSAMDEVKLYALPKTEPWTLDRFLEEIKVACKEAAGDLNRKSVMIEDAVEDLIGLALQALNLPDPDAENENGSLGSSAASPVESGDEGSEAKARAAAKKRGRKSGESGNPEPGAIANLLHVIDKNSQNAVNSAAKELRRNYSKKVADKLAYLTKTSLKILSKHFASASTDIKVDEVDDNVSSIVFVLTAYLSIPDIEVRPSIDEVQTVLVQAGKIILSVSKGVATWRKNVKKKKERYISSETIFP